MAAPAEVAPDDWLRRPAVTEAKTDTSAPLWLEPAKADSGVVGVHATVVLVRTPERMAEVREYATLRVPVPRSVSAGKPWLADGIKRSFWEATKTHIFVPRAMGLTRFGMPATDQRVEGDPWPSPPGGGAHGEALLSPYPAQARVIEAVAAATSGDRRLLNMGIVTVPCGMGKTNVAMHTLARWARVAWVVTPNITICAQVAASARRAFPHLRVEELHSGVPKRRHADIIADAHIVVATLHTAGSMDPDRVRHVGAVIVDECHHTPADTLRKALTRFAALRMLGMTATPSRSDGLTPAIEWILGPNLARMHRGPTPGQGFLIKYKPTSKVPPAGDPKSATKLHEAQAAVLADPARNRLILDAILQLARAAHAARFKVTGRPGVERPKVIALFPRRAHAVALARAVGAHVAPSWDVSTKDEDFFVDVPKLGPEELAEWKAVRPSLYVGSMSAADRDAATRECSVFFCTDVVAREGLHMDPVFALFNASWVSSEGVMEQLLGRAARVNCLIPASRVVLLQDTNARPARNIFQGQRKAVKRQGWSLLDWVVKSDGALPGHTPAWVDPSCSARPTPPPATGPSPARRAIEMLCARRASSMAT